LSDEAFREAFGTEEQCRAALVRLRWPDGFVCPCCSHRVASADSGERSGQTFSPSRAVPCRRRLATCLVASPN